MSMEFIFGIFVGAIFTWMCIAFLLLPALDDQTINKVLTSQKDCFNPYYYYGEDSHKTFCDRINVQPVNGTVPSN